MAPLGSTLLGNILAGKTKTPGLGLIRAGEGIIRAVHDKFST